MFAFQQMVIPVFTALLAGWMCVASVACLDKTLSCAGEDISSHVPIKNFVFFFKLIIYIVSESNKLFYITFFKTMLMKYLLSKINSY